MLKLIAMAPGPHGTFLCDMCASPLFPVDTHPWNGWCCGKHTAWLCKATELKGYSPTTEWVCVGCAYTVAAEKKYPSGIYNFTELMEYDAVNGNVNKQPCRNCAIFACAHLQEKLPLVIQGFLERQMEAQAQVAQRELEKAEEEAARLAAEEAEEARIAAAHRPAAQRPAAQWLVAQAQAPQRPADPPPAAPPPPPGLKPLSEFTPEERQTIQNDIKAAVELATNTQNEEMKKIKERMFKIADRQRTGRPLTFSSWESMSNYDKDEAAAPRHDKPADTGAGSSDTVVPFYSNMARDDSDCRSTKSGASGLSDFLLTEHDPDYIMRNKKK